MYTIGVSQKGNTSGEQSQAEPRATYSKVISQFERGVGKTISKAERGAKKQE